jgi:hypothetical protein
MRLDVAVPFGVGESDEDVAAVDEGRRDLDPAVRSV